MNFSCLEFPLKNLINFYSLNLEKKGGTISAKLPKIQFTAFKVLVCKFAEHHLMKSILLFDQLYHVVNIYSEVVL